ncbi:TIGR02466 family protein [Pantanalinema rosaneae CENA516]|uniref:TIGR02466 family protein n=1 Tax=Pantanalinema rosaneae TaxID=1620701 RepID=UPI003D6DB7F0
MSNPDRWTATYHQLFPSPLFVFDLQDHAALDQQLLQIIYQLKATDPGAVASNVLGWHSRGNLFDLTEFQGFKQFVDAAIADVAQALGYGNVRITPANCWANISPKFASNKIHDHANCLFSGVYYLQTAKDCGNLMFYDPRSARTFYKPLVKEFTPFTADAIAYEPQAGLLLIFPSWLKHGVEPNMSDIDRVSVSFNYIFN